MSDIRYNQWLHNSGTGGVSQDAGGNIGIGTTAPLIPVGTGNTTILNVGVVTANYIYGDGSNLTGITDQTVTISNQANNRVITGTGATNTLNGEANLTFDGAKLTVTSASKDLLYLNSTHSDGLQVPLQSNGTDFAYIGSAKTLFSGGSVTDLGFRVATNICFGIGASEKLRITSAGQIGVNHTNPRGQFVINSTKNALVNANCNDPHHFHLSLKNEDENNTAIGLCFSHDATVDRVGAAIIHQRSGNGSVGDLRFYTCATEGTTSERLRIDSSGRVLIGTEDAGDSTADDLTIANSSVCGITIRSGNTTEGNIFFADGTTGDSRYRGILRYEHNNDAMVIKTAGSERFRITSTGNVGIGTDAIAAQSGYTHSSGSTLVLNSFGSNSNWNGQIRLGHTGSGFLIDHNASSTTTTTLRNIYGASNGAALTKIESGTLTFHTGTSYLERLKIDSSGHLTLQGGKIYGEDNASNSFTLQSTSGNNNHSRIEIGTIQSSDNGGIHFYTAGSSTATRHMTLKGTSGNLGVGPNATDPGEQLYVSKNHNGHTRAVIQNNWGANATAQLKLVAPTDELQMIKYASGAAALNLSNNSTFYTSIGGNVRHQIRGDSADQTTHIVNTPANGGVTVDSQYVTQVLAKSGNYTNFRVTVTQSSWGSFFLKMYVSGHDGNSAYRWVTGYCNTGFSTIRHVLSNDSGNFGSGSITYISGQQWRYDISVNTGTATHPVMGVELIFGGNGNLRGSGAVVLAIT